MHPLLADLHDFDAVVLANGLFPTAAEPLRLLRSARYVVCCDGAVEHWPQAQAVVGDGDSVPASLRSRLIQIDEQDDNDLTKATRHCLSMGMRRLIYLGATGGREDHALGNIALMGRYMQEFGVQPLLVSDYGWLVPASGDNSFAALPGMQVSLFNLSCNRLSSEGLKWQAYPYRQLWQGTLNEALGNSFTISADGNYLIYRTYEKKGA